MLNVNALKRLLVVLAACAGTCIFAGSAFADDAQDNAALKEQMRVMMQRIDDLTRQVQALSKQQQSAPAPAAPAAAGAAPAAGPVMAKVAPEEPLLKKIISGFYGTLDVSFDDTTKGLDGEIAYHIQNGGTGPGLDFTNPKGGPVGQVGWMPALSTNKSVLGYRGSHKIDGTDFDLIYQIETQPAITSSPGLNTSYTQQSNITKAGIGYGDTFVGVAKKDWGKLKFGTVYSPYKKSTDRMNPFSGMLGDYAVVMGNSGGDNRVEFGTRLDHSVWYESPTFGGMFSFDVLFSPGANRTYDNVVQSAGSPDCSGGNMAGSGNLLLNCDDGGFGTAWSVDLKFETGPLYLTAAYEIHKDVNRNSDGIGSNNPTYANLMNLGNGVSPLLDWGTYNAYVGEYGQAFVNANGFTPPYLNDVVDEYAAKVGAQYTFDFGLAVSGIWEHLARKLPANMEFQNERTRNGSWVALTQNIFSKDSVSVGWAHAGATPGDPGGQHNYNPLAVADTADMYTIAWKHRFDKNLYWYIDAAETINHGNVHYDLGAGGRGLTTDCHDGTNTVVNDYSSAGPTTWGGCRVEGISSGLNFKF